MQAALDSPSYAGIFSDFSMKVPTMFCIRLRFSVMTHPADLSNGVDPVAHILLHPYYLPERGALIPFGTLGNSHAHPGAEKAIELSEHAARAALSDWQPRRSRECTN